MGLAEGLHRRFEGARAAEATVPEDAPRHRASVGCTSARARSGFAGEAQAAAARSAALNLRAMAVEFPLVAGHPNRLPFEGVLTLVDVASDKAPSGSRGHRVLLTQAAAEQALPSLLGMAVDYKAGWDGHDARQKCGIITSAAIKGQRLAVSGYLYARDYPEMEQKIQSEGLMGMSYELADAHVADMRAPIWTLTRATFTGAAILLRDKAAYRDTSFHLKRAVAVHAATRSTHQRQARATA